MIFGDESQPRLGTNKQSGIIDIEVVGHKLQQCKGLRACAAPGDRERSRPFAAIRLQLAPKQRRASSMVMIIRNISATNKKKNKAREHADSE